jgi:tight adherence protein B
MFAVFEILTLAVVFAAAAFVAWVATGRLAPWWQRRTANYVDWIVNEHKRLFEPISPAQARRLVNISIFVPAAIGWAAVGPVFGVLCAIGGAFLPKALVRYRGWRHGQRLDNQLGEALILMANAMKAGLTLLQAIEIAAEELRPPLVDEFRVLLKEIRLGRGIDDALMSMAERLKMPDLEIAVHSIVTLRETGGNLSETFMTVAQTITDRKKVEDKIKTVTAQGVYQGVMLCAMPWVMAVIFYVMDPTYMAPMFRPLGYLVWTTVIILDALGMWMILKVVKIDV